MRGRRGRERRGCRGSCCSYDREDVDSACGRASVVLRGYGRRVGAGTRSDLLSGLTPPGCLDTGPSAGSQSFRHPPARPVRSAWPVQEAGVSQLGGQRVRAIPQPEKGDGNDNRRRRARHHRRRGYPRGHPCRRRAGSPGRAARDAGVPGYCGRVRRTARLAGRVRAGRAGRRGGDRQLRRGPGPAPGRGRRPGGGGGPAGPAGPPPRWQVRPAGRGQRGAGRAVRPGGRRPEGPGRRGRGDPGADGGPAQRPR